MTKKTRGSFAFVFFVVQFCRKVQLAQIVTIFAQIGQFKSLTTVEWTRSVPAARVSPGAGQSVGDPSCDLHV